MNGVKLFFKILLIGTFQVTMMACIPSHIEVDYLIADSLLSFDKPTLIAYYCPDSKIKSEDWDELYSDFNYHTSGAFEMVNMKETVETIIIEGCKINLIHDKEKVEFPRCTFGYCIYHPNKGPKFIEGIMTDMDLALTTHEYLKKNYLRSGIEYSANYSFTNDKEDFSPVPGDYFIVFNDSIFYHEFEPYVPTRIGTVEDEYFLFENGDSVRYYFEGDELITFQGFDSEKSEWIKYVWYTKAD